MQTNAKAYLYTKRAWRLYNIIRNKGYTYSRNISFASHNESSKFPTRACFFRVIKRMRKYKVFMKLNKEDKVECICLRSKKRCDSQTCERDEVYYDQYKGIKECMIHNKGVNLHG